MGTGNEDGSGLVAGDPARPWDGEEIPSADPNAPIAGTKGTNWSPSIPRELEKACPGIHWVAGYEGDQYSPYNHLECPDGRRWFWVGDAWVLENDSLGGPGPRTPAEPADPVPPPQGGGGPPPWLNPRFLIPAALLVAAVVALSIVLTRPAGEEPGPIAAATTTSAASTTGALVTTTTAATTAAPTTTATPSTLAADPLAGLPGPFAQAGQALGLDPTVIRQMWEGLKPYDGTWYESPGLARPEDPGPGLTHYGWFQVGLDPVPAGFGLTGGGAYDIFVGVVSFAPEAGLPEGAGTQIGVAVAYEASPERAGIAGFAAPGWDVVQFLDGSGRYTAFLPGDGYAAHTGGFGLLIDNIAVFGLPSRPATAAAISNFYRQEAEAGSPAAHQWVSEPRIFASLTATPAIG